jgi:uncharacterized membrane protein
MEGIVILLLLFGLWLLFAPIVAMVKAKNADQNVKLVQDEVLELKKRLRALENELRQLDTRRATLPEKRSGPSVAAEKAELDAVAERVRQEELRIAAAETQAPPPLPERPIQRKKLVDWEEDSPEPMEIMPTVKESEPARETPELKEPFSLEQFMGVKLFAWLGGVAMAFGVIFFVKYAFENNLIPPAVRIALGFVVGIGLLVGGLLTHRLPRYQVLAQAFCATGVLILYGVSFAAHAIYHFPAFGTFTTFGLMALITLVAFLLAVRLNALVVAVLGMLGGFLTPVLLSTEQDHPFGLFGYIAMLDIGLLAVSRHGRWRFLTSAAAVGTALIQLGWYGKFFTAGHYVEGGKTLIPMGIILFFLALFLAAGWIARQKPERHVTYAVLGLATVAMGFAFAMLAFEPVAARYFLLYGFILLVHLAVIAWIIARPQLGAAQVVAAGAAFLHLALWSAVYLTAENLIGALVLYLGFAGLHSVVPVLLARRSPYHAPVIPLIAAPWFAPLALLMMLLPLTHLTSVSMVIWVGVLLVNLLAIGLAIASGAILSVLASLILTMGLAAFWLLRVPVQSFSLMPFLGVITGFSALFAIAGKWMPRSVMPDGEGTPAWLRQVPVLPLFSAVLPFVLLILALLRLPVANPAPVFGVALLMVALLTGMAVIAKQGPLVLAAMFCTLAVEAVWHSQHFQAASPMIALFWYLGFYALFLMFPFVFRKACAGHVTPWIASALSGVGHFLLVYDLVKRAFPNSMMGLLPAAFAVPSLIALVMVLRTMSGPEEINRSRMAWFGGVALLFITLIFPIQFDRQWLTVAWAIEGALLLWLFRRVPHPGLQLTGLALLAISFIRLTLNPAVFSVYPRSGTAILNWHLYTYGLVALAQCFGGYWFTKPAGWRARISPKSVLFAFGGILLFLLLNIEIADYFTEPGASFIAFRFGGNFARDMTYSIAWGLFSLVLLGIGFRMHSRYTRYAAIGLLAVTLLKVFTNDLATIESIFRIGALVGVAVIAFIASFLYQRFYDRSKPSS